MQAVIDSDARSDVKGFNGLGALSVVVAGDFALVIYVVHRCSPSIAGSDVLHQIRSIPAAVSALPR